MFDVTCVMNDILMLNKCVVYVQLGFSVHVFDNKHLNHLRMYYSVIKAYIWSAVCILWDFVE